MISDIKLKFGSVTGGAPLSITASPVTIFVGPNNSGKSRVLSEIQRFCESGHADVSALIVDAISFTGLSIEDARRAIGQMKLTPSANQSVQVGHVLVGNRAGRVQVPMEELERYVTSPDENTNAFCGWFLRFNTLKLDGRGRIDLVTEQPAGDLQKDPQTSLQVLLRDDAKRHEVRRIVYEAFGLHFVVDPTSLGKLRVRLSTRAPVNDMEERGIHAEAVAFHANAQLIDLASDGAKAFIGIVTEVIAGDPRVVLIDEPEAFLHPSLASKLGLELARASAAAEKRILISTHSPMFVMGCIQSGAPLNIVRLTYREGVATARVLPSGELLELMRHPLLRSANLLNGLFYEFVVVTESDADRAFYQEVNERLLESRPEWGIPNCLFLNAQNKQTVQTIIRPLRKLGIPAAAIVDIDVLKEGGANWANLMDCANFPAASRGGLAASRVSVKAAMDATGKDMKRDGGVSVLGAQDRAAAEDLVRHLAEYGVFVVSGGELESWLKPLGATSHGPPWLIQMFEKMGEDAASATYVRPTDGDVWEFIGQVKRWLVNPNRRGIPS